MFDNKNKNRRVKLMTLQEVLLKNAGQHIYHRNGVIKNYSIEIDPGGNIATLRSSDNLPFQIIINLRSKILNLKTYPHKGFSNDHFSHQFHVSSSSFVRNNWAYYD